MNLLKKLSKLVLAVFMTFTMSATAFAAEGTHSITIEGVINSNDTFKAYQIFAGNESNGTLSNVVWGDGVKGDELLAELVKEDTFKDAKNAADVADKLGSGFDTEVAKAFAAEAAKYLTATTSGTYENGKITGLADGYYLVQSDKTDEKSAQTRFILTVVKDAKVKVKADVPEMEKKVKEKNDSTNYESDWQDASDYDIGDNVPYQIKTTIVSNYADYEHYYLAFNDTMDAGLTFNNDVVVYVNGHAINGFTTVTGEDAGGYTFVTSCLDITTLTYDVDGVATKIKAEDVITVEYSAKLNEKAKFGSEGNKNTANMEFSNNPNTDQEGKPEKPGKTPDDTVITFTYKTVVNKVDSSGNALAGAGFTLFKKDKDGNYNAVGAEITGTEMTEFEFKGLDAGEYELRETTTPAGYNTISPIKFTITATYDTNSADPKLLTLEVSPSNVFTVVMTEGNASYTGEITADVVNNKGSELPSTGGIGTTLFYVFGGMLVVAGAALLLNKRRTENE